MEIIAGRVAVVTGGASGIGRSIAEGLAAVGAIPVTWDLHDADVLCDVADVNGVRDAMNSTVRDYGVPTIIVANAGVRGFGSITDVTVDEWDSVFSVNTRGVFLVLQAAAREMISRGLEGQVVISGSVNGFLADPNTACYAASKAATMHLARVAARELGGYGIRVNAIAPGPTDTAMMADTKEISGYWSDISAHTPLGRIASPSDIAEAVIGLVSMSWVTGHVLVVDGGASLATARGSKLGAREKIHPD